MSPAEAVIPRVVVVDDERDMCVLVKLRLEHHGFDVRMARTTAATLALLEWMVA